MTHASATSYRKTIVQSELSTQMQRAQMTSVADEGFTKGITLPSGSQATVWRSDTPVESGALDRDSSSKAPSASGVMSSYVNGVAATDSSVTCSKTAAVQPGCVKLSHLVLTTLGGVQVESLTKAGVNEAVLYQSPFTREGSRYALNSSKDGFNAVYELPAGATQYNYYIRYADLGGSDCKATVLAQQYKASDSPSFSRTTLLDAQAETIPSSTVQKNGDLYGSVNIDASEDPRYVGVALVCEGSATTFPEVSQTFLYAVKGA
jgi:hypothetical protein